jgi:hypothetical protein
MVNPQSASGPVKAGKATSRAGRLESWRFRTECSRRVALRPVRARDLPLPRQLFGAVFLGLQARQRCHERQRDHRCLARSKRGAGCLRQQQVTDIAAGPPQQASNRWATRSAIRRSLWPELLCTRAAGFPDLLGRLTYEILTGPDNSNQVPLPNHRGNIAFSLTETKR